MWLPVNSTAPDLRRFLVDAEVDLAPGTPFRAAVPAGVPLAFALDLDPGAADRKVQRAAGASIRDGHGQRLPAARQGAEVGHAQSRPIDRSRLLTKPVVCPSAMPNSTFIVGHTRMAVSL